METLTLSLHILSWTTISKRASVRNLELTKAKLRRKLTILKSKKGNTVKVMKMNVMIPITMTKIFM